MPVNINAIPLEPGDLIFTSIPYYLYRKVAAATGSKASHVGIVFPDAEGAWQVAESAVPCVQYSKLDRFLARSENGWFCVRRLKSGLTPAQVDALRQACDARLGKLYHLGFKYESSRQFCSKFVYDAYREATGIEVGTLESFSALLHRQPDTSLTFWRLWFFGLIPWSRLTITPASQMQSPVLGTIIESPTAE